MFPRSAVAATAALVLSLSKPLAAQNMNWNLPPDILVTAVTFTVPLNLTQLPPDLERVKVVCGILGEGISMSPSTFVQMSDLSSESYPFKHELFVTAGQVVATASIQVMVFVDSQKNPIGKTAQYGCRVMGFSTSLKRWEDFSETPSASVFMLKPAPNIQGSFVWVQ